MAASATFQWLRIKPSSNFKELETYLLLEVTTIVFAVIDNNGIKMIHIEQRHSIDRNVFLVSCG